MPKSWKEILSDSQAADDVSIEVNGEKLTLGDLRSFQRELESDVARREEGVQQVLQALENQAKQPPVEAKPEQTAPVPSNGSLDYSQDPLFSPLWGRLTAIEKQNKELVDAIKAVSLATNNQIAATVDLQYRDMFARNQDKFSGVTYESAVNYARDHHITNARGIIDPIEAADRMTMGARIEKEKSAEYERGKREAEEEIMRTRGAAAIAMPGISRSYDEKVFKRDPKADLATNMRAAVSRALGVQ